MKNLKKVLALVLALAMSLSVVAFAGTTFPDVEDTANYAEAAKVLKSLDIMVGDEQGNFNPDKTVTRAEMAKILCAITGTPEVAPAYCGFNDVPADHWASGYISVARNSGWIDGYGDGNFGPNDIVLYEQAIKLVMSALNYGIFAEKNGGYPYGWLMAAAEANVTRAGATGAVGEECSRAKIAMIVYYAIEANLMKQEYFSENDDTWKIQEYETLLSKYLNTFKVEGKIVESYKHNTAYKDGRVDFNATKIFDKGVDALRVVGDYIDQMGITRANPVQFQNIITNSKDAADLLGYAAVAYIKVDEDGDYSIESISAKSTKNKAVEITDKDLFYKAADASLINGNRIPVLTFEDANTDGEIDDKNYKISYWANDRDTDANITVLNLDKDIMVVEDKTVYADMIDYIDSIDGTVNGAIDIVDGNSDGRVDDEIINLLVPAVGSVKFVDTDNNGKYDLIEKYAYGVGVVSAVNVAKQKISFNKKTTGVQNVVLDKEVNLHLTDVKITLDGEEIGIEDIQEKDVLTISTNNYSDPTYYDIIVTRKTVEGKVNATTNTTKRVFYIDNEPYKAVENGLAGYGSFEVGEEGIFYLDAQGKVAAYEDTSVASGNYAVVDTIANGNFGEVTIQMRTYEGVKVVAPLASEIKINGHKKVKLTDAPTAADFVAMGFAHVRTADEITASVPVTFTADLVDPAGNEDYVGLNPASYADYKTLLATLFTAVDHDTDAKTPSLPAVNMLTSINPLVATANANFNKIVTFAMSGDEVSAIDFAVKGTTKNKFGYIGGRNVRDVEWQSSINKFAGASVLAPNALVLKMDLSTVATGSADGFADWKFMKVSDLIDEGKYAVHFFTKQETGAGLAVLTDMPSELNQAAPLAIYVDQRTGVYGENEETVKYVTYIENGELVKEPLPVDPSYIGDLAFGDAFLYQADDDGIIKSVAKVFDADTVTDTISGVGTGLIDDFMDYNNAAGKDNEVFAGTLVKIDSDKLFFVNSVVSETATSPKTVIADTALDFVPVPETAKVVQYKKFAGDGNKLSICDSISDLEVTETEITDAGDYQINDDGDVAYVFVRMYKGTVVEVIGVDLVKNI